MRSNTNISGKFKCHVGVLIGFFAVVVLIAVISAKSSADGTGNYPAPENGDWIIENETVVWNETIVLNGNLSIEDGGNLTFRNVTLKMNCSDDGEFGIVVKSGGKFFILDYDNNPKTTDDRSNITANNTEYEFKFLVNSGAQFEMKNSELSECGYNRGDDGRGGVTIQSHNALIENSTFYDNFYGIYLLFSYNNQITNNSVYLNNDAGIYFWDSNNNNISNCNILNNDDEGIYFRGSNNNTISSCNILNNDDEGIYFRDSNNNTISSCNILNNRWYGIEIRVSSNNTISGCNISNNDNEGIDISDSKNNTISGCNISNNDNGGIDIVDSNNNSISGCNISNNDNEGIDIGDSNNNSISGCNISNNLNGIYLDKSNNNIISGCNISNNDWCGIDLCDSRNITISNNTFFNDGITILGYGDTLNYFIHLIENNTVNDKPLLYYTNEKNIELYDIKVGQIILVNCSNLNIKNINISNTDFGIEFAFSENNNISHCNISNNLNGIYLDKSNNNTISRCNILTNNDGIELYDSSNNTISGCNILNNNDEGIELDDSNNNTISSCNILNNDHHCIELDDSNNNVISGCSISNNWNGICIRDSNNNTIINSTISNSPNYHFLLYSSSNLTSINQTFSKDKVFFYDEESELIVKWYFSLQVLDKNNNPLQNTNVRIQDNENSTFDKNFTTNLEGFVKWVALTEYNQNKTMKKLYTPYTITAEKDRVKNSTEIIIDQNREITIILDLEIKDWMVTETEIRSNETIILDGNLTIEPGGNLTFNNVTLIMNCSYEGQYHIEVKNGGKFNIYDNDNNNSTKNDASNITSYNENKVYNFYVRNNAELNMKDSFLSNCGFWDINNLENLGLYVNSENVLIYQNNFSNNYAALFINSSNLKISNNTFWNNNCAIYLNSSNATIENNTILKNNYGIYCDYFSEPKIMNNNIFYNNKGIYCLNHSNPKIEQNDILENEIGILCNKHSSPIITYNDLLNNVEGIKCLENSKPVIKSNKISFNKNSGVYCEANSNATIEYNNILNNQEGIYCDSSSPKIENNGILNNVQAIYCKSSSPNIDDNIISNNNYGIVCWYSEPIISDNILINNTFGLDIPYNSKNTILKISNTYVNEIDIKKCYFLNQENKTIENKSFDFKFYKGSITAQGLITLYDCNNFTILNCELSNNENGIYSYSSQVKIINNLLNENENGLYCRYGDLEIKNNTISNNSNGVSCWYSNPTVTNNQFYNNNDAISCWYSNLILINNTLLENDYNIYLKNSDMFIDNSSVINSDEYDFYLEEDSHLTALNTTFDKNKVFIEDEDSDLIVKWFLSLKVINKDESAFKNVRVNIQDNENGTYDKIYTTDSNGLVKWLECTEFIENFTSRKFFVPYTINVSKYWSWNKTSIIIDKSKNITIILEIEKKGDWIVTGNEVYFNETIILTGNLTIKDGGNLTFRNVTLLMNCSFDGEYGIVVENGGEFHILDYDNNSMTENDRSNITAVNNEAEYKFFVDNGSVFKMINSELNECGYVGGVDGRGGLTIKTDNTIIENSRFYNNYRGIYLYSSSNNTITNNSIYSNKLSGIYLSQSRNNQIINNTISSNEFSIFLLYSSNNTIINNNVSQNKDGFFLSISKNNQIINSTISNSFEHDFYFSSTSTIKAINTTFNKNKVYFNDKNSELIVKWYLSVKIIDSSKNPIENANVKVIEKNGSNKFYKTNKDGFVKWIECTEYIQTVDEKEYFTPHRIIATKNASYNSTEVIMNQSKTIILILDKVTDWIVYGTEIRKNETIILNGNLTIENGGYLEFHNVTLLMNCKTDGMYHIEVKGGGNFYIYDNGENNETKEDTSIITAFNEDFEYLFFVRRWSTLVMKNSELHECGFGFNNEGLIIESDDAIIDKNIIKNNYCGIYIDSCNPLIINNTIENNNQGIYIINNGNPEIINNNIKNNENTGIRMEYSNPKISKNVINDNLNGIYSFYSDIIINDTIIFNNSEKGISFEFSKSSLINCKISNSKNGIKCYKSTISITNSSIRNSTDHDFHLNYESKIESINTSFEKVNFEDEKSELICEWYLDIEVFDQNGQPANNTNIHVWDNKNGSFSNTYFTDLTGWVKGIILIEYMQDKNGKVFFTPHSIDARNGSYQNYTRVMMSESKSLTLFLEEIKDWIVRYEEIRTNETIILTGNLIIMDEGFLTFKNVTLIMNCSKDGEYGIEVMDGGKFFILDYDYNPKTENDMSNITAFNDDFEYKFLVNSGTVFEMRNSELSECGYKWDIGYGNGGLTIKTNNTIIEYSNLFDNHFGICISYSNNNIINANNIIFNNHYGIFLYSSSNIVVTNNNIYSNNIGGISLRESSSNRITNNSVSNNTYGISLSESSSNRITNNSVSNNAYGISLVENSENNKIVNNTIFNNKEGIHFYNSNKNTIINSTISNSTNNDLLLRENSSITSINTSFSKGKVYFEDEDSKLNVKWHLTIKIAESIGNPISNAIINIKNIENDTFDKTFYTNSKGCIKWIECTEYIQNGIDRTYYTPHTIIVNKDESHTETQVTMDSTKTIYIILDTNPPEIYTIKSEITDTTATITWETNELCTSKIKYGLTTNYNFMESDNSLFYHHTIKLTNLTPETNYYFYIISIDESGNTNQSEYLSFTTNKETVSPPPIKNLLARDLEIGGVIELTWDASMVEDLDYYNIYQSTSNITHIDEMLLIKKVYFNKTTTNIHDLINNKEYYFAVTAVDINGNENKNVTCVSVIPTKRLLEMKIEVLELKFPEKAKVEERISITITLVNSGDIPLTDVKIEFYFGNQKIGEKYLISTLELGKTTEVSIEWKAIKGNEKIKIKFIDLNTGKEIGEGSESENFLNVEDEKVDDKKENLIAIAIFILIISVGTANILWNEWKKRIEWK